MANYNVYIPKHYEDLLKEMADQDESIGQVVKRLVLGILDGDDSRIAAIPPDALGGIKERLDQLEVALESLATTPPDFPRLESRLSKIDQHLHWCQQAILDAQQKFKEIDHDLYYGESLSFQELRESIARIEKAILQGQSPTSPPPTVSPPDAPPPRLPDAQKRKPKNQEPTP